MVINKKLWSRGGIENNNSIVTFCNERIIKERAILINSCERRNIFIFCTASKSLFYVIVFDHGLGEAHILQMIECHPNITMHSLCKLFHCILAIRKWYLSIRTGKADLTENHNENNATITAKRNNKCYFHFNLFYFKYTTKNNGRGLEKIRNTPLELEYLPFWQFPSISCPSVEWKG
jgi:hypothetical protein